MKKRLICFILSFILAIFSTLSVYSLQPRWSYTGSLSLDIYFSGDTGSIEGSVDGYLDVTKIEGTLTLYKKNILGFWSKTGDTWDLRTTSHVLEIWETFDAESGKQYKAELDVDVYVGSNSENITDTATGTCP